MKVVERAVLAELWRGLADWYIGERGYWRGLLGLAHGVGDPRGRVGLLDEARGI